MANSMAPQRRPGRTGSTGAAEVTGRTPRVPAMSAQQPAVALLTPAGTPPVPAPVPAPGAPMMAAAPAAAAPPKPRSARPAAAIQPRGQKPVQGQRPVPAKAATGQRPASVAGAKPAGAPGAKPAAKPTSRQTSRSAHLRITRLDLVSMLKMSFLFAFMIGIVCFVSLFIVWRVLEATGAIESVQNLINSVLGNPDGTATVQLTQYLNSSRVTGFIAGLSVINVFLLTLLGTLFGVLYNFASVLFGGFEVTLEV